MCGSSRYDANIATAFTTHFQSHQDLSPECLVFSSVTCAPRPGGRKFPALSFFGLVSNAVWAGHRRAPLPFESTFGVIARIAWLNGLNMSALRKAGVLAPTQRRTSLYEASCVQADSMTSRLAWSWYPVEAQICTRLRHLRSILWAADLRFCPLCLQGGFHAIWFQLHELTTCPVHAVSLVDRCQSCLAFRAPYRVGSELLQTPFQCYRCGEPLAGSPILGSDFEEFEHLRSRLDVALTPLERWSADANQRLAFLNEAARKSARPEYASNRYRVLLGALRQIAPVPQSATYAGRTGDLARTENAEHVRPSVLLLAWRTRLSPRGSPIQTDRWRNSAGVSGLGVYKAVLRSLIEIARREKRAGAEPRLEFDGDRCTNLRSWHARELALQSLRCMYELPWPQHWEVLDRISLRGDVLNAAYAGSRFQRSVGRAMIIACYGALHALAQDHLARDALSRSELARAAEWVLLKCALVYEGESIGVVVMPYVDDLANRFARLSTTSLTDTIQRINAAICARSGDS